jgi:hypothetical protein
MMTNNSIAFSKVCTRLISKQKAKNSQAKGYLFCMFGALVLSNSLAWGYGEEGNCTFEINKLHPRLHDSKIIPYICDFTKDSCTIEWFLPAIKIEELKVDALTKSENQLKINITDYKGLKWIDNKGGSSSFWPAKYPTWVPSFNTVKGYIKSDRIKTIIVNFTPPDEKDRTYLELTNIENPRHFQTDSEEWKLIICELGRCIYHKKIFCNVKSSKVSDMENL